MPNTQSKDVNLTKRVQTRKGLRYCPVACLPMAASSPIRHRQRPGGTTPGRCLLPRVARERLSGYACRWAKMQPMPTPDGNAK